MTPNGPATDLGKELTVLQLPDAVVREVEPDSEPEPLYHQPKAYVRYSSTYSTFSYRLISPFYSFWR